MAWLWLFAAVVLGAFAGATLLQDPGYVLIRAGDLVLESSIAAGILGAAVIATGFFLTSFGVRRFLQSLGLVGQWRANRQQHKWSDSWRRSVLAFAAGDWSGAARALQGIKPDPEHQLDTLLVRAWHAVQTNNQQVLVELVHRTEVEFPALNEPLQAAISRWQLQSGALDSAFERVSALPQSTQWAGLLAWCLVEFGRWDELSAHWLEVEKWGVLKSDIFRPQMALLRAGKAMADAQAHKQAGKADWQLGLKNLPKQWRNDPKTLELWAESLVASGYEVQARELLQSVLAKHWHPSLVRRYGLLSAVKPLGNAILQTEGWLKKQPEDPELLLALGRLLRHDNKPEAARKHLLTAAAILQADAQSTEDALALNRLVVNELGQLALFSALHSRGLSTH